MEFPDLSLISTDTIPASFHGTDISVDVLRIDKIHPVISGNKWFKLFRYLEMADSKKKKRIVSYGGPWSNHIIATAAAARLFGFTSLGIIRGEENGIQTPILERCRQWGMELRFSGREEFDRLALSDKNTQEDDLVIPMGGFGLPGMEGASRILEHCQAAAYSHICCATGTGTMMAGILNSIQPGQSVRGYSAVKNDLQLENNLKQLIAGKAEGYQFSTDKIFGGFAKYNEELIRFMNDLYKASGIPTDIVYTAKLCYAVIRDMREGIFPSDSRILIIHSGGLTGNHSLKNGQLIW